MSMAVSGKIPYVIRRNRGKEQGIFGFDFLLPCTLSPERDVGCYETSLKATIAAEERFGKDALMLGDVADMLILCAQRRHVAAMDFLRDVLSKEGLAEREFLLRRCPYEIWAEVRNLSLGLV